MSILERNSLFLMFVKHLGKNVGFKIDQSDLLLPIGNSATLPIGGFLLAHASVSSDDTVWSGHIQASWKRSRLELFKDGSARFQTWNHTSPAVLQCCQIYLAWKWHGRIYHVTHCLQIHFNHKRNTFGWTIFEVDYKTVKATEWMHCWVI